jgi:molybdopterin converting factor small subunit
MSVEINLPPLLQTLAGGTPKIDVEGSTVQACLEELTNIYPRLKLKLFRSYSELANGVEIYVNREKIYPNPLLKLVKNGDIIHISFVVLGG